MMDQFTTHFKFDIGQEVQPVFAEPFSRIGTEWPPPIEDRSRWIVRERMAQQCEGGIQYSYLLSGSAGRAFCLNREWMPEIVLKGMEFAVEENDGSHSKTV